MMHEKLLTNTRLSDQELWEFKLRDAQLELWCNGVILQFQFSSIYKTLSADMVIVMVGIMMAMTH